MIGVATVWFLVMMRVFVQAARLLAMMNFHMLSQVHLPIDCKGAIVAREKLPVSVERLVILQDVRSVERGGALVAGEGVLSAMSLHVSRQ